MLSSSCCHVQPTVHQAYWTVTCEPNVQAWVGRRIFPRTRIPLCQTLSSKNAKELRTTAPQIAICSSKTRSRSPSGKNDDFEPRFKRNFQRKIINAKIKKSAAKARFATFMQPLQCDSQLSDAKHNSITLAAAAARNVDAAIPLRSANTELQSANELRTTAPQIARILQLQNRISTPWAENRRF